MSITKDYVSTPLGRVHVRRSAAKYSPGGRQPALVLFHQTASASVMFEALMARLEPAFFLFAPDTPGFGGTDPLPGPVSVEAWSEILLAAMRAAGIEEALLFGHHTGASIAAEIAARWPEVARKIALSGPAAMTGPEQATFGAKVEPFRLADDGAHLLAVWQRVKKKEPGAPLALLHREAALTMAALEHHRAAYDAVLSHDLLGCLSAISCPALVMAGEHDLLFPYLDRAHRSLPRGEKHVIPGAGTYVCDREPDRVAAILRAFFLEESA